MIGLITLGHSPRPDHEAVYERLAPAIPRTLVGALDALSSAEARALEDREGESPLVCLLADRTTVEIPLPVMASYIEKQLDALAADGVQVAVILCCGGFPVFAAALPVILPGIVVPALVKATCPGGRIGIIVPNRAQEAAAVQHWKSMGVAVRSAVVSPYESRGFEEAGETFRAMRADLVAIDCMGFTDRDRNRLRELCGCPVLLPTTMVARMAVELHEAAV